ncbi:RHS repeat-associated core domain-containing protein [Porticoccus sp. W117]|uniref:RHS repeat domain-containing protein n=1 Tax=Porticoccus sp. W117 TaxID=3054777 RepID=UPI002598BBD5|nr:RHS repeat-associated core domain-containing protein [Porticoccus sp. W117]MDM3872668.1 RHS repeat-associated core domain-containing protein [Porticoccus sp. W117]
MRQVDATTGVQNTTWYRQDFPFQGHPKKVEVRSKEGHLLSETENTWKLKVWDWNNPGSVGSLGHTGHLTDWSSVAGTSSGKYQQLTLFNNGQGIFRPYLAQSVQRTYDLVDNASGATTTQGSLLKTVTTETTEDGYGNPLTQIATTVDNTTGLNTSGHQYKVTTTNVYDNASYSGEASNYGQYRGLLTSSTVQTERTGETTVTRKLGYSYYTSTTATAYNSKLGVKGLLKDEIVEPDNSAYTLTTTHLYNVFGKRTRSEVTDGSQTRYSETRFDTLGRYEDAMYNSLGHKTSDVISRNAYGQPTEVEDINGASIYMAYSAFGRKYFERSDTGAFSKTYLSDNSADMAQCPSNAEYVSLVQTAGGGESRVCYDKLGREVRTLAKAFDGRWSASDIEYDTVARTARQSEPYFTSGGQSTAYWTQNSFDILGRPKQVTHPDNSTTTHSYSGFSSTLTNDLNQSKTQRSNALGEAVQITDHLNGSTHYRYDAQGNMTQMTDPGSHITTIGYDLLGRKTAMNDPDKGNWSYAYNKFGELTGQTDGKGQSSAMVYDLLGRMTSRIDRRANNSVEADTLWVYDTAANGLGQLANVQQDNGNTGTNDYVQILSYDPLGRVINTATSLGTNGAGGAYIEEITYDQYGRVFQTFDAANDPNGAIGYQGLQHRYNNNGYLQSVGSVQNNSAGNPVTAYQTVETMDARGNITTELYGNGVRTARFYDPQTGRLTDIDGTSAGGSLGNIQELDYQWDTLGNLTSRNELSGSKNLSETFQYDGLNRLTHYTVGGATKTVSYDALGNITHKSDVGSYSYGQNSAGPHAATTIAGQSYSYDANGNNTSGDGRTLSYSTFDKPITIQKGSSHTTAFEYGPDRMRYKRTDDDNNNGIDKTTWYIGSVEIIENADNTTEIKRYIGDAAIVTLTLNASEQLTGTDTHYRHYDHLGSLDVITNAVGSIVEELSFDPWGERRNGVNWSDLTATELAGFFDSTISGKGAHGITTRGFTGHEMLDEVGIIHMNGRIYDATAARFLQADPIIQDPLNTQSLNRYSYVWNNPLNATDPSGYVTITLRGGAARSFFRGLQRGINRGFGSRLAFGSLFKHMANNGFAVAAFTANASVAQNENNSGKHEFKFQGETLFVKVGDDWRPAASLFPNGDPANGIQLAGRGGGGDLEGLGMVIDALRILEVDKQFYKDLGQATNTEERISAVNSAKRSLLRIGYSELGESFEKDELEGRKVTVRNSSTIRFTQTSVKDTFTDKDKGSIDNLTRALKTKKVTPDQITPIRIYRSQDGNIYSLDNRRLLAAQNAGVEIRTVWAADSEVRAGFRLGKRGTSRRPRVRGRKR